MKLRSSILLYSFLILFFAPTLSFAFQCGVKCPASITIGGDEERNQKTYKLTKQEECTRTCKSAGCQWECPDTGEKTATTCVFAQVGGGGCLCGKPDCENPKLLIGCGGPACAGGCTYTAESADAYITELSISCKEVSGKTVDIFGRIDNMDSLTLSEITSQF